MCNDDPSLTWYSFLRFRSCKLKPPKIASPRDSRAFFVLSWSHQQTRTSFGPLLRPTHGEGWGLPLIEAIWGVWLLWGEISSTPISHKKQHQLAGCYEGALGNSMLVTLHACASYAGLMQPCSGSRSPLGWYPRDHRAGLSIRSHSRHDMLGFLSPFSGKKTPLVPTTLPVWTCLRQLCKAMASGIPTISTGWGGRLGCWNHMNHAVGLEAHPEHIVVMIMIPVVPHKAVRKFPRYSRKPIGECGCHES